MQRNNKTPEYENKKCVILQNELFGEFDDI